jgi:hypothetical protein
LAVAQIGEMTFVTMTLTSGRIARMESPKPSSFRADKDSSFVFKKDEGSKFIAKLCSRFSKFAFKRPRENDSILLISAALVRQRLACDRRVYPPLITEVARYSYQNSRFVAETKLSF